MTTMTALPLEEAPVRPRAGDPAPDFQFRNHLGEWVRFSDFWRDRPTAFVFIRHFMCPYCRLQLAQLNKRYGEFSALGAQVVAVGMGSVEQTARFRSGLHLTYPMLCDEAEEAYDTLDLIRHDYTVGGILQDLQATVPLSLKLMANGAYGRIQRAGNRTRMGGTIIVDTEGRMVYTHRDENPSDHATVDDLIAALAALAP
jgi:peroxiredoxin